MKNTSSPLKNKRVLITRPLHQSNEMAELLLSKQAEPIVLPSTEISFIKPSNEIESELNSLSEFDWILFTSSNGVKSFFNLLNHYKIDLSAYPKLAVGAVGEKTAHAIKSYYSKINFISQGGTGKSMALEIGPVQNQKILIPRGNRGKKDILELLSTKRAWVKELKVYETKEHELDEEVLKDKLNLKIDFATFTSPSSVEVYAERIQTLNIQPSEKQLNVCIGPVTAQALNKHDLRADLISQNRSIEGMVEEIENYLRESASD